jgi:hypothetical protein
MPPVPTNITLSLVETFAVLQLREIRNELTAVAAGSLLVAAAWLLFG